MRIIHVIPGLTHERGGPSTVVAALTRHQAKTGHQVTVLTTDQGQRNGERPLTLSCPIKLAQARVKGPDRVAYAPDFVNIARRHIPGSDVVHVHSIFTYPVHVALRESRSANVPVVLRPCGLLHRYSLRRSAMRKRAYLTVWGKFVRQRCAAWHYTSDTELSESWPRDCSSRFVLPNGIDPDQYRIDRDEAMKIVSNNWPEIDNSPYVLFLGRLDPKKRLDLLMEAFRAGAPPEFKLVVAGPDPRGLWSGLTHKICRSDRMRSRIVRLGMVTGRHKVALLARATLFALPSENENFAVAVLEALASGTPVLLSPHVDLAKDVAAYELGRIVPLDVASWRGWFAQLLADPKALDELGDRAQRCVSVQYDWRRVTEQLNDRYRWVIHGC